MFTIHSNLNGSLADVFAWSILRDNLTSLSLTFRDSVEANGSKVDNSKSPRNIITLHNIRTLKVFMSSSNHFEMIEFLRTFYMPRLENATLICDEPQSKEVSLLIEDLFEDSAAQPHQFSMSNLLTLRIQSRPVSFVASTIILLSTIDAPIERVQIVGPMFSERRTFTTNRFFQGQTTERVNPALIQFRPQSSTTSSHFFITWISVSSEGWQSTLTTTNLISARRHRHPLHIYQYQLR
jgi:hypothetical protein